MQTAKRTMSPWVFYTLVSTITSAVFGLIGLLGLSLAGNLSPLAAMILATMYLFMGLIIGWSIGAFTKRFTKEMKVKGFGLFQGRLGGLFVGGMAGFEIGNGIGAILGALIFYFLGLWIGPKVSKEIANWIERNYDVLEVQTDQVAPKERGIFPSAYVLLFPFVFVIFGFLLKGIPIDVDFDPQYLPVARIVAVMFSLLTIGSLYWIKYLMVREMKIKETPAIDLLFIGTFFSVAPMIYGFILFLIGASLFEFIIFAGVSEIAGIIWLVYESRNRIEELPQLESEEDHVQNNIGV